MLGIYNNTNTMYMCPNQNYGYAQAAMNPYQQQQTSVFEGYQQAYQTQPINDVNSMLLLMINQMLPMIFGALMGQQTGQIPFQQPVQPPVYQPPVQQPQENNSNDFLKQLVMILLQSVIRPNTGGKTPVEIYDENVVVESWGDPHFAVNGQQAFDFQGKSEGLYKMLDNSDIELNAKFGAYGDGGATVIKDQNLELKDTGINVVSHGDGKFEILQDGKEIADETNYKTDQKVIDLLKENNIEINFEGNILKTTFGERTLSQRLNGGYIDNVNNNLMKNDSGLLTQTIGAVDDDFDGKSAMKTDINKDGKVDESDILNYNVKDQFMVHTEISGTKCKEITPEIEDAIKKDIEAGIKLGSAVKGFSTEHGYDARQWNEYLGEKLYTVKEDELLTV